VERSAARFGIIKTTDSGAGAIATNNQRQMDVAGLQAPEVVKRDIQR